MPPSCLQGGSVLVIKQDGSISLPYAARDFPRASSRSRGASAGTSGCQTADSKQVVQAWRACLAEWAKKDLPASYRKVRCLWAQQRACEPWFLKSIYLDTSVTQSQHLCHVALVQGNLKGWASKEDAVIQHPPLQVEVHCLSSDFSAATRIVTTPMPPPEGLAPGSVLVRRVWAGVNASDINYTAGRWGLWQA